MPLDPTPSLAPRTEKSQPAPPSSEVSQAAQLIRERVESTGWHDDPTQGTVADHYSKFRKAKPTKPAPKGFALDLADAYEAAEGNKDI